MKLKEEIEIAETGRNDSTLSGLLARISTRILNDCVPDASSFELFRLIFTH